MPDTLDLIGRFGDMKFLHELWLKAKVRLPQEIEEVDAELLTGEDYPTQTLYVKIHKIRGAIANFFNKTPTLEQLILCENLTKGGTLDQLRTEWSLFKTCLGKESKELEEWLNQEGYSS